MTLEGTAVPDLIGRYQVRAALGVGGFATVYRAFDAALDTEVAVKVLLPHLRENADLRHRFVQEARLLRRVQTRHVVKVFDIGELDDGLPYFVMEFAHGGSLAQRFDITADQDSLGRIIDGIANGLAALHQTGIVHRDIKPENLLIGSDRQATVTQLRNSLLGPDEHLIIGDLGFAKDQTQTKAGPTVTGGTPYFQSPEQMRGSRASITPASDVYAATGVLWELIARELPPEAASVALRLATPPAPWQPVLERGLQQDPMLRYASIEEWAADAHAANEQGWDAAVATGRAIDLAGLCPYKGMAAFQPEDSGLFHGRDELIDTLVARVQNHSTVVIAGPSGSGKSSLMRAGLIPRLQRGAIAGSNQWRVAIFNPGSDAVGELVHQLRRLGEATTALGRDDLPMGARRHLDDGPPTLLAIDQFEELFTLNTNRADRELFLDTLAAMTESVHSRVKIVCAIRADFYGLCAAHPWLADRINEAQVLVGPMSRVELREAVATPAQRAGLQLEDGLTDLILDDVGADGGSLPLLGHALMETWLRRRGSTLTLEGYHAAGGVSGAIAQRADEVCLGLDDSERDAVRRLLLRLTNPGEGTPDTRRRVALDTLRADPELQPVVERLASARLLTVDGTTVEVAHEALLHSWPQLIRWIDQDRESLQTRRRISAAARDWAAQDRNADLLYRGTPLAGATEWADAHPRELDPEGQEFLEASRELRDEAQREHEAIASRNRRNRRRAVAALGAFAAVAVIASIVAFGALRRSQANERDAQMAQAQALAAAALASANDEPLVATALALEGMAGDGLSADARDALVSARVSMDADWWLPQPYGDPVFVGDMISLGMDAEGDRFFTGGRLGEVVVWDRRTRSELARFPSLHDSGVEAFDVSADGAWMASGGGTQVFLWDLATRPVEPRLLADMGRGHTRIWDLAFSPNGNQLAVATEADGLEVFDTTTGGRVSNHAVEGADLLSVVFLDDTYAAVGDGLGRIWIIDAETGTAVPAGVDEQDLVIGGESGNDVWELIVNESGSILVSSSDDNTARTFQVTNDAGLEPIAVVDSLAGPRGIILITDGTRLIAGNEDGRVYRADPQSGDLVGRASAPAHVDRITDAAAADGDRWMVTLSDDQAVQVWRYVGPAGAATLELNAGEPATKIALSPSGERVVVSMADRTVVLDAGTGEQLHELSGGSLAAAFVSEDVIMTSTANGVLRRWDSADSADNPIVTEVRAHDGEPIRGLAASPNGTLFVSSGRDGRVILWDANSLTQVRELTQHSAASDNVVFFADGQVVASVGFDGVRLSSIDGSDTRLIRVNQDGPRAIAVHPDGTRIAVGGGQERVDILTLDGELISSMSPHPGGVWEVAFSADGLSLAATGRDGAIQFWDWATETRLGPALERHSLISGISTGPVIVSGPGGSFWSAGPEGLTYRISVLDLDQACELASGVINDPMRVRLLSGEPVQACLS